MDYLFWALFGIGSQPGVNLFNQKPSYISQVLHKAVRKLVQRFAEVYSTSRSIPTRTETCSLWMHAVPLYNCLLFVHNPLPVSSVALPQRPPRQVPSFCWDVIHQGQEIQDDLTVLTSSLFIWRGYLPFRPAIQGSLAKPSSGSTPAPLLLGGGSTVFLQLGGGGGGAVPLVNYEMH